MTRSLTNYTDGIQYFRQRKDSKGNLFLQSNEKMMNDLQVCQLQEKYHDQQINGDTAILSPISSGNSEKATRKTLDAAKVFNTKGKLQQSRSPHKKGRERSYTYH